MISILFAGAVAMVLTLLGTRWAIGLSMIPGLLAALAIVYAIRHTPAPHRREREPVRLEVKPVLQGGLGRLFVGISAFELGICAATLMVLRATDLLEPGHGTDEATTIAAKSSSGCSAAASSAPSS